MQTEGETILIVDDNSEVLSALELELSEYFNVTTLLSAKQALALLQNQSFAAIISDVRMPEIDGLTLIKECAAKYPDMVRILLTAFDDEEVQETALSSYGAYKMSKPWDDDLVVTVQNALKQRSSKMELRKSIDLGNAAIELDNRLHLNLKPAELIPAAVSEILRVRDVKCLSVYEFDDTGAPGKPRHMGSTATQSFPELTTRRQALPEKDGDYYTYAIPIGEWPTPVAAFVCQLSSNSEDTIKYLDFVGRQAHRTLLLIDHFSQKNHFGTAGIATTDAEADSAGSAAIHVIPANLVTRLSTQSTIVVSAAESLRDLRNSIEKTTVQQEIVEIASDLDSVYLELAQLAKKIKSD